MAIHNFLIILSSFLLLLFVVYILWAIIPSLSGLPWIPTRSKRIHRALELAQLSPGEILYDLGSGDGRVLILAAREFGAHAVGVEISPIHCLVAWVNVYLHGVSSQVSIKWASFYKVELRNANVIFIYMTSRQASRLRSRLESQLHPGARVLTIACEIGGWQPAAFDQKEIIYLYLIR